jgi:hypothetical protein
MNETQVNMALMLLTVKLIHPSSELETQRWLKESSGAMELYGEEGFSTTRYRLYQAATKLYEEKQVIENELYSLCTNLFSQGSKIVVYDLTNLYVEGRMAAREKAQVRAQHRKALRLPADRFGNSFLHIKSEQKAAKESSMDRKITERFEQRLSSLNEGLSIARRTKKITAVHESVGRLKDHYSKVAKRYNIEYEQDADKGIITKINWTRLQDKEKPAGEYFLRYLRKSLTEDQIWGLYNLTGEVEASFRCLKTDLNIRPIHHQKDQYIEPHIWLGIMAYQVVNYICQPLKQNGISHSWKVIVEKMKTQRCTLINMEARGNKRFYTKLCTRPNVEEKKIYDALAFKDKPYVRKSKVVTQL